MQTKCQSDRRNEMRVLFLLHTRTLAQKPKQYRQRVLHRYTFDRIKECMAWLRCSHGNGLTKTTESNRYQSDKNINILQQSETTIIVRQLLIQRQRHFGCSGAAVSVVVVCELVWRERIECAHFDCMGWFAQKRNESNDLRERHIRDHEMSEQCSKGDFFSLVDMSNIGYEE